ncbi:MAG: hypothetical protein GY765_18470 [bacterium]|nr:hypothetical protein [bacterium]
MLRNIGKWLFGVLSILLFITVGVFYAESNEAGEGSQIVSKATGGQDIQVPPTPFSEDIFPCSECHGDMEVNRERRTLEDAHDDILLQHDEKNRWCLDCHDADNRDMLHLADGRLVDFKESYKLCGQCHGPKLKDWRNGIHGRRTGSWNGTKKYLLCAHCHNPHAPRFKSLKPEPPPAKNPGKPNASTKAKQEPPKKGGHQ